MIRIVFFGRKCSDEQEHGLAVGRGRGIPPVGQVQGVQQGVDLRDHVQLHQAHDDAPLALIHRDLGHFPELRQDLGHRVWLQVDLYVALHRPHRRVERRLYGSRTRC